MNKVAISTLLGAVLGIGVFSTAIVQVDASRQKAARVDAEQKLAAVTSELSNLKARLAQAGRRGEGEALSLETNGSVEVALKSDGLTWVSVVNACAPEKFTSLSIKLRPGRYEVVGRRAGFQDVVVPLEIRNGQSPASVAVVCSVVQP